MHGLDILFISDGKCGEISVGHVLRFMTGCSSIPHCGLFKKIDIHFASAERYPVASTCTFGVTLPLNLTSNQRLKAVLKESLIPGQAFGVV